MTEIFEEFNKDLSNWATVKNFITRSILDGKMRITSSTTQSSGWIESSMKWTAVNFLEHKNFSLEFEISISNDNPKSFGIVTIDLVDETSKNLASVEFYDNSGSDTTFPISEFRINGARSRFSVPKTNVNAKYKMDYKNGVMVIYQNDIEMFSGEVEGISHLLLRVQRLGVDPWFKYVDFDYFRFKSSVDKSLVLHNGEYKKWTNDIGNTNIIPAMTSDTNGNIVLSTNSTNTFTYFPYKAFDRSIVANSGWANGSGQYPAWLKINLGTSRKVGKYTIVFNFTTRPSCFPKDWEFQGSNDDQNWDILDSQKLSSWTLEEKKEFLIANPKEYKYHRIYVKSGDPTYAVFTEIELFEVGQDPHWSITTVDQIKEQGMDSSSPLLNRVAKELDSIPMNKRE